MPDSQLTDFLGSLQSGQEMSLQNLWPATITIGGQSYAAATSGFTRGLQLVDGPALESRAISFRLAASAFDDAGQPLPHGSEDLVCTAPARLAGRYQIESPVFDPTGAFITLKCNAPPQ